MRKYIDSEAFFKVINTLPYKDTSYPDASAYNGAISDVADMLTHFPAADVEPRWIPVTERLPELNRDVLLSVRQSYAFGEPDNWCVVGGLIDKEDITWATNYGFHDLLYSNGKKHTVWVSAWMPLPEPYKRGEWKNERI